jgi:hypothetical protein
MIKTFVLNDEVSEAIKFRLRALKNEFFNEDSIKVFRHLATNKSLKAIVYFVFNVV